MPDPATSGGQTPESGRGEQIADLLARVEAATGADEELDALILCALAAPAGSSVERSKINGAWCIYTAPGRLWERSFKGGWRRTGGWPLTASLDAALALVERVLPGWGYDITYRAAWGNCTACVIANDRHAPPHTGSGPNPALALLAALLRALGNIDGASLAAGRGAPGESVTSDVRPPSLTPDNTRSASE